MPRVSAEEIIVSLENMADEAKVSLDNMVDELRELLPKKEANYGNRFKWGLKQVAIRISEKADRIWDGESDDVTTDSMHDTLVDIVGWAAIGRALMVKEK